MERLVNDLIIYDESINKVLKLIVHTQKGYTYTSMCERYTKDGYLLLRAGKLYDIMAIMIVNIGSVLRYIAVWAVGLKGLGIFHIRITASH